MSFCRASPLRTLARPAAHPLEQIPNVKWIADFKKEEVAFGVWKLVAGCVITDAATDPDAIIEAISALHAKVEHHHGGHGGHHSDHGAGHGRAGSKKLVRSVEFRTFSALN